MFNTQKLPLLPLRDIVVFPHMIVPLFVGRDRSVKALESVMNGDKKLMLVTQKDSVTDDPGKDDLYEVGTIGTVLQLLKLPDGTVKVLVEGGERARILDFKNKDDYLRVEIETYKKEKFSKSDEKIIQSLARGCLSRFKDFVSLHKKLPSEVSETLGNMEDDPAKLADTIAAHIPLKTGEKQQILKREGLKERLELIYEQLEAEIDVLEVENKIRKRVKGQMEKTQRDYYLNEQMKAIQKELGDDNSTEVNELEERVKEKIKEGFLTEAVEEKLDNELKKLKSMNPMSAESTVVRNYIDWMLALPWEKKSEVNSDLEHAQTVLDEDHYSLEEVKERIIEFIAVQKRTNSLKGPILCLVGPPGVGKTSLGKSVARATGRDFARVALGGVRDESEIRGHRRTYVGSMPGKIIQSLKRAGHSNPVFMLDEIDKMSHDFRGDPASALLEVLDPEQNDSFVDHYMELEYDLSDVMFICTANSLNIPSPLKDRMEIIRIPGYTEDEKVNIAERHLIKKQLEANGLKDGEIVIPEETIRSLIQHYTREAGVRNLNREIAKLCRKTVKKIVADEAETISIAPDDLQDFSGVRKHRYGQAEEENLVGVTTGLAWTEVGGDILSIEAVILPGKGKVSMTGQLGDVMKESVTASEMLIKSRAQSFGIDPKIFEEHNIHVHVPEGATPKDGPSAGIAMVTSIVSVLTDNPVLKNVAMTGEITLRGRVLPIGGLKEKLLAALRAGVTKVLIPAENEKNLIDVPDNVKDDLEIVPVQTIDEVLLHALQDKLCPISDENDKKDPKKDLIPSKSAENGDSDVITH